MRVTLLLLIVGIVGCSASRPPSGLLPQYAAAPPGPGPILISDPIAPTYRAAHSGDRALDMFLSRMAIALRDHDWRRLAQGFEAQAYAEQYALMKSENGDRSDADVVAQILAETIGLGNVGNNLNVDGRRNPDNPFQGLDRISDVEQIAVDPPGSAYRQVTGLVILQDGSSRSLSFSVIQDTEGRWRISVPMG